MKKALNDVANHLVTSLVILVSGCMFTSCSSDSKNPIDPVNAPPGPTVDVTKPAVNDTVGGRLFVVEAVAQDDIGVANVRFYIDGVTNPALVDGVAPFRVPVSTEGWIGNSQHTVFARVEDTDSNTASSNLIAFDFVPSVADTLLDLLQTYSAGPRAYGVSRLQYAWVDHVTITQALDSLYGGTWHLAVISSPSHQARIDSLPLFKGGYWIGGHGDAANNFYWVTGVNWAYEHWLSGQPSSSGPNSAVAHSTTGGWYSTGHGSTTRLLLQGQF